ncbi:hypothetical protein [Actibacterium pelagium]|uniref:Secreted protein n=1 Tax=Actibacterium pelagium TaxID=2029103 RepID=A0A917EK66_9RHOB|nr:hypothetical protein [Actibacterium pelagium]GGE47508.1 hypothetical protein GCM10011517_14130 [Actibacterium pelagium]
MTRFRSYIAYVLSLCLVLASVALATARGQAEPTTAAVICSGFGTHVVYLDEDGNPVTGPTLCPDGVAAFVIGASASVVVAEPSTAWATLTRVEPAYAVPSRQFGTPPARGPPSLI